MSYHLQHNPWFSPPALQYVARLNPMPPSSYSQIEVGDRVTIVDRFGKEHTGRAVMPGSAGWVLNMGGRHGTPGIATIENTVRVRKARGRGGRGYGSIGSPTRANPPCAACGMESCGCGCQGDPSRCVCAGAFCRSCYEWPSAPGSTVCHRCQAEQVYAEQEGAARAEEAERSQILSELRQAEGFPGPRGPEGNPEYHPGGSHRYKGRLYRGGGRYHHHDEEGWHKGGGQSWGEAWHAGGGHPESNPARRARFLDLFVDAGGNVYTAGGTDQAGRRGYGKKERTVGGRPVVHIGSWPWSGGGGIRPSGWKPDPSLRGKRTGVMRGPWSPKFQAVIDRASVEAGWRAGGGESAYMTKPHPKYPSVDVYANPGGLRIRVEQDRMGNVTLAPVNQRLSAAIGRHLAEFGQSWHGSVFLQGWQGDQWLEENLSPAQKRDVEQGWGVTITVDAWTFLGWVGWDAQEGVKWNPYGWPYEDAPTKADVRRRLGNIREDARAISDMIKQRGPMDLELLNLHGNQGAGEFGAITPEWIDSNPFSYYGEWESTPYVGWNPGCTPNAGGGLDCYYTNPYGLPSGLMPGAHYALNPLGGQGLGPEYRYLVSPGENVFGDWPYLLSEVYDGQGDPVYALSSRLHAYGETMASREELEASLDALERTAEAYGEVEFAAAAEDLQEFFSEHVAPDIRDNPISIRGRSVPTSHSKAGRYHHVRVGDPDEYTQIRTKQLGRPEKGIKARVGRFLGSGPRGGKTEIQSYLFDAERYTPEDVARWMEGHPTPLPLHMDVSSREATDRRYKVYGEAPVKKRPKRKKVAKKVRARKAKAKKTKRRAAANPGPKCGHSACSQHYIDTGKTSCLRKKGKDLSPKYAPGVEEKLSLSERHWLGTVETRPPSLRGKKKAKKKRGYKVPPAGERCTAKTKSGTCKGRRMEGSDQCALHAKGIARGAKKAKRARCAMVTAYGDQCRSLEVEGRPPYCAAHWKQDAEWEPGDLPPKKRKRSGGKAKKNPKAKAKKDKRRNRQRCRTSRTQQCSAKTNCGSRCKSFAVGRSKFCFMHAPPGTTLGRTRAEGKKRAS